MADDRSLAQITDDLLAASSRINALGRAAKPIRIVSGDAEHAAALTYVLAQLDALEVLVRRLASEIDTMRSA